MTILIIVSLLSILALVVERDGSTRSIAQTDPPSVEYQGSGNAVIEIEKPGDPGTLIVLHIHANEAAELFNVDAFDQNGNFTGNILRTKGPWDGEIALNFDGSLYESGRDITRLEISATGPWRIEAQLPAPEIVHPRCDLRFVDLP